MIRMNQSPYSTHYLQIVFSAAICLCLSDHNLIHSDVARNDVSPERSVVWGAGLQSGVVLPVRYFFIQAVNTAGENFTHSPGRDPFRVEITSRSKKEHIRIHWVKPLDRNDGSFLMRYRLYESATEGLKIEVFHRNKHVAQSPYILKGPVYHEYCDCPESDPLLWQEIMSCPAEELQASRDFSAFPSINLQRMLVEVPKRFGQRGGIVHYTILNNKIYRRSLGKYTDFKMFSDEMLLSLTRKVHMPDVEFYINVGDWPMENRQVNDTPAGPVPIISWCGSTDTRDIVLPTYDITHSTLETLRGVSNDLLSIQGNTGPVWSNKTAQAFFRGRDSREERLRLVELSKEHPELLDAGITRYFFFREKEEELGTAPLTGFFDFFKYKYQVNVDGTVAAYRFPYLMLGNSLVLKQASSFYEHFYTHLKPGKHYVPVKQNLSDLIEKITWAKENDAEVEKIAREGQALARELLQPFRLYCYYFTVFQKYAKLQASKPEIREGMEFVPQPSDFDSFCSCQRNKQEKDEL